MNDGGTASRIGKNTNLSNYGLPVLNHQLPQARSPVPDDNNTPYFDELDCIENFKMARRCTISLPFAHPKLMESFADYFIVGGYEEQPYQIDFFDRSKMNLVSVDVAKEVRRAIKRFGNQGLKANIVSVNHILVPRLKWSDR